MSEQLASSTDKRKSHPIWRAFGRLATFAVTWFVTVAFARGFVEGLLEGSSALETVSNLVTGALVVVGAGYAINTIVRGVIEARRAAEARRASAHIDEALERFQDRTGGNLAGVSLEDVVKSVKENTNTKVGAEQLTRLVEQRKQKRLVDDQWFQAEVSSLIVDYLQPLPRNAKRVLNRFRVNMLIAERRGLFTSEPKVMPRDIGKWLVLGERWPLLRRSLSAVPETMRQLERDSRPVAAPPPGAPDPFMDSIKVLAPFYVGDEDLRTFIRSEPQLAKILPRLVHYGDAEATGPQAGAA